MHASHPRASSVCSALGGSTHGVREESFNFFPVSPSSAVAVVAPAGAAAGGQIIAVPAAGVAEEGAVAVVGAAVQPSLIHHQKFFQSSASRGEAWRNTDPRSGRLLQLPPVIHETLRCKGS